MKNRLLAGPYLLWMVVFTLIPLGIVFYYAFTDSITGGFTLENLTRIGTYLPIFFRSIGRRCCQRDLSHYRLSRGLLYRHGQRQMAETAVHAGDASHVHEFSASHPGLGSFAGGYRHHQPNSEHAGHWTASLGAKQRCSDFGYGLQLPALYDYAALYGHHEDRPQAG